MLTLLALLACDKTPSTGEVTWHEHVAPLVAERCAGCHTDGTIAPFSLDSYESAAPLASAMSAAVDAGRMPPWLAQDTDDCQPLLPWRDDLRLTDEEKALLRDWAEAGAPEGDPADAAELPIPPELDLRDPDVVLPFTEGYLVQGERDDFQCFVLNPGNTELEWVEAIQLDPGNPLVDHHGLVFMDASGATEELAGEDGVFPCFNTPDVDGYLMATWTPGAAPMTMPDGIAMPLPAGARIVVQMHYHPDDEPQIDLSTVSIRYAGGTPEWAAAQVLIGNYWRDEGDGTGLQPGPNDTDGAAFVIPAGAQGHTETMIYEQTVDYDFPLLTVGTHMHYVGTDMKIELRRADPDPGEVEAECLIRTPDWDFNWQRVYQYDAAVEELPEVSLGDQLVLSCTYDNSLDNPFVAEALADEGLSEPHEVVLGEETLDEMCLGLFGILVPPAFVENLY